MNRRELKEKITELFEDYTDRRINLTNLEALVRIAVDEFADEIVHETKKMLEILDRVS